MVLCEFIEYILEGFFFKPLLVFASRGNLEGKKFPPTPLILYSPTTIPIL